MSDAPNLYAVIDDLTRIAANETRERDRLREEVSRLRDEDKRLRVELAAATNGSWSALVRCSEDLTTERRLRAKAEAELAALKAAPYKDQPVAPAQSVCRHCGRFGCNGTCIANAYREPPAPSAEPFETWHARECPTTGIQARGGKCSGYYVWKGGVHEKWHRRTCHEVWQRETQQSAAPASEGVLPIGVMCAKCHKVVTVGGFLSDGRQSYADCAEPPRAPEPTAREAALERAEKVISNYGATRIDNGVDQMVYQSLLALLAAIRATDGAR